MQYHLNGFRPGNLQVSESVRQPDQPPPITSLPTKVDVLIVGCGPTGLTLARQLAEFSDISTCIVDQNAFWEPDSEQPNHIKRKHKVPDVRIGLSCRIIANGFGEGQR